MRYRHDGVSGWRLNRDPYRVGITNTEYSLTKILCTVGYLGKEAGTGDCKDAV